MARDLEYSSSQYLMRTGGVVTSTPATMACWFKAEDTSALSRIMGVGQYNSLALNMLGLAFIGTTGGQISALHRVGGGDEGDAQTSATITDTNWHHIAAVFNSNNSRSAFLDGGNKATNTNVVSALSSVDRTIVGGLLWTGGNPIQFADGAVAECGWWNAALTDGEIAMLAAGYSPALVRPDALVAYHPFFDNDSDGDRWGQANLTAYNSPTYATHPPIIYRSRPRAIITPSAPSSTYANYHLYTNNTFSAFGLGHTTGLIAS